MKYRNLLVLLLLMLSLISLCLTIFTDLNDSLFLPLALCLNLAANAMNMFLGKKREKEITASDMLI